MEPTEPASSLKIFSRLSCSSLGAGSCLRSQKCWWWAYKLVPLDMVSKTPWHRDRNMAEEIWEFPNQPSPSLSVQAGRAPLATSPALASLIASFQEEEPCSEALQRHGWERRLSLLLSWWHPARPWAEQLCQLELTDLWCQNWLSSQKNPSGKVRLSVTDGVWKGIVGCSPSNDPQEGLTIRKTGQSTTCTCHRPLAYLAQPWGSSLWLGFSPDPLRV